ncbi:hypothetical protein D3C72_2051340 [compost metagenome]
MLAKKSRRRSMGSSIRSCRLIPGKSSSCARVQPTPRGMKRLAGGKATSASCLLPTRHSRLSVLRRAPPQVGHGV